METIDELIHLSATEIVAIHDSILSRYPGLAGIKLGLSADALVGRINANLNYSSFDSIEDVAALYAEVIARGHVFNDGNKRTALVSMVSFLDINGYQLIVVDQDQLADKFVEISEGKLHHKQFSFWLKPQITMAV